MITRVVDIILGHRRAVVGIPALVGFVVIGIGLLKPRVYEGTIIVSPVSNRPGLGSGSLAASVLGAGAAGDFQSTPILVSRIARLDGVLLAVALDTIGPKAGRVIDRMRDEAPGSVDDRTALETMRTAVSSAADLQSGLVTIRVVAEDSALIRRLAAKLIQQTSAAFVNTTRAQGSALKHAQDARLSGAQSRLTDAENAERAFRMTNRPTRDYSVASLEEQRLQRELRIATDLYSQAVTAREAAAARELEEAPALVVVDGLPSHLQPQPRGLALKAVSWSVLAGAIVLFILLGRARLADERRASLAL
jgi:uncharacterized protein involved in exopolysaccharide biosynthesis